MIKERDAVCVPLFFVPVRDAPLGSGMGRHNVLNACASMAVAYHAGVPLEEAAHILSGFTGAHRRFEKAGDYRSANVFHDYAHHPTEIKATLAAARQLADRRLYCVFQPHTYSRTKALFQDFIESFDEVDRLVLLDIYAARETNPGDISASMLADAIAQAADSGAAKLVSKS